MSKFKVGQRVVTTEEQLPYYAVDCVGTVGSIDSDGDYWVVFDDGQNVLSVPGSPNDWCVEESALKVWRNNG